MSKRYRYDTLALAMLMAVSGSVYADPPSAGASSNSTSLNSSDNTFLQHAAQDGAARTQLAQMALDKSSDPKVKKLAQTIVDDQGKANDQMKNLAQTKHVTLPTDISSDSQKQNKKLQAKSGQAFDEAWSKAVVSDHQSAVKSFTQEGKDAKDNDVKQWAQGAVPTLNSHLKSAQALAAVPAARDDAMADAMKASANEMNTLPATVPSAAIPDTPAESAAAATAKH